MNVPEMRFLRDSEWARIAIMSRSVTVAMMLIQFAGGVARKPQPLMIRPGCY